VRGDAGQVSAAGAVLDDDQRVEAAEQHGVDVDEIGGDDAAGLGGKELLPGRAAAAGRGTDPASWRICHTVEAAIWWPSLTSSPCTRLCPTRGSPSRCGSPAGGSRLWWTAARDCGGSYGPICARPAAGARRAASPELQRTPRPTGGGESIATVPPATAGRPACNGPGRSGGARSRSRVAAPGARRPWTPGAGSAPSGSRAGSVRAGRQPK
jgi:hypothetical protein